MTWLEIQIAFPHKCPFKCCAICGYVRARAPREARSKPERDAFADGVTTCQSCGEFRIADVHGKLPPHRCVA